jgi:hypothetical protein
MPGIIRGGGGIGGGVDAIGGGWNGGAIGGLFKSRSFLIQAPYPPGASGCLIGGCGPGPGAGMGGVTGPGQKSPAGAMLGGGAILGGNPANCAKA